MSPCQQINKNFTKISDLTYSCERKQLITDINSCFIYIDPLTVRKPFLI